MPKYGRYIVLFLVCVLILTLVSCGPGNYRWDPEITPNNDAGFWAGLWHGIIIVITFIVSLFTDEVGIYEINNNGWRYNLGFIFGLAISMGSGAGMWKKKWKRKRHDWDEIGDRIEQKVKSGIKSWIEETDREEKEKEWEELAQKIEEKVKRLLKEWVDKE
jgi:hypothetical protein